MTTRILFVDDEPHVLTVLRLTMQRLMPEVEADFVAGGVEALALMDQKTYDVVVSDMRMPGMNGAQLLTEVMRRSPRTVRIILSGYTDMETVLGSVGSVHQYLLKPFDPRALRTVLARIRSLNELLFHENLRAVAAKLACPPSVPSIYLEIVQAAQSPDATLQQIVDIVSLDPALTAKSLHLANSAFFGFGRSVSSVSDAVQLLGVGVIQSLALVGQLFSAYDPRKCPAFKLEQVWPHSVQTGVIARNITLARRADTQEAENAFTAGVVHDIGKLILADSLPGPYGEVAEQARSQGKPLHELERELMGATHSEVGAYLLGVWSLPLPLVESVAFHHEPGLAPPPESSLLTAVHVANALEHERAGTTQTGNHGGLDTTYLDGAGLGAELAGWRKVAFLH